MTNRRHFYSFKINQNASAQNFSQNPPCPDKPGKPLFLRVHAVRHNNAFCNGHPASRFCCRVAPKLRLRGTKMLPFCKTHPASTPGNRLPRSSGCTARRCCLFLQNSPGVKILLPDRPEAPAARHEDVALLQNSPGIKNISRREFWGCFSKAQ